ncbi:MAG: tetratricopeptide repeat protein [Bacteroidales bacterium]
MKLKFIFRITFLLLCISGAVILYSCSTKKNTFTSRTYHNLTTHYNVYWNGNESFKNGRATLKESVADNYNSILKVYNFGTAEEARKIFSDMDRAIEKAGIAIPRHSMFIRNVEHNKWIDDCYLLIGKAQFYKQDYNNSRRTMEFLQKQYPGTVTDLEASLWYIRSLLQQKKYEDVVAQLEEFEAKAAKVKAPYRIRREIPLMYADYYLFTGNMPAAKTNLKQGLALASDRKMKARINFILGQIAQKEKNFADATEYYSKVIKSPASFEMIFNARINMAKSFDVNTGDKADLEKQLRRMLKDTKNKDYYDQVYYALAELATLDHNDTLVMHYLKLSVANSSKNNYQKSTASLQLADMFFKKQNYEMAAAYYDTTIQTLPREHPDYAAINSKTLTLTELVKNLRVVQYEDSLQRLANLPEAELLAIIQKMIDQKTREEEQQKALLEQQMSETSMMNNIPNMRNENMGSVGGGGWYFYNPSAISFGFSEFMRKWGRRKLEDNWRLTNKRAVSQFDENIPQQAKTGDSINQNKVENTKPVSTDPKKPQTYIAQLPKTKEQLEASNEKIASALLNLGYIYKDGLNDIPHSVEAFEDLAHRFPEMKDINRIYYQLYLIAIGIPDETMAAKYKDIILVKYPETDYAQLLKDPDYNKELLAKKNRVSTLYQETFQAFKRAQYRMVLLYSNQAIAEYTDKDLIPRFEYLRALSLGKTAGTDTMVVALNKLVLNSPNHPVTPLAKEILQKYDKNKTQASVVAPSGNGATPEMAANTGTATNTGIFAQSSDTLVPDIYKLNFNTTHFYIMMVDGSKVNVNAAKTRISDFVSKEFLSSNLSVNTIVLDAGWQMISISSFKNSQAAMDFYNAISKSEYVNSSLGKSDYKQMIISIENYPVFYREKKYNGYLNFFRKNYLK